MTMATKFAASSCPGCGGAEWKLAKVFVLHGTVNINTESAGGGVGVSAGLGRGQGGGSLNYQGLNLSTTGTHTQAAADAYAPPVPPDQYQKKDYWLKQIDIHLSSAASLVAKFDEFAVDPERLKPGVFDSLGSESALRNDTMGYRSCRSHLEEILKFEKKLAIWEKTRVCTRCGESYILKKELEAIRPSFEIPKFQFEGQDRKCPSCSMYLWKRADIYFQVKRNDLDRGLTDRKNMLAKALEFQKNPDVGGFWSKILKKIFTLKPETAQNLVTETQAKLNDLVRLQKDMERTKGVLSNVRVCLSCDSPYQIS